MDTFITDMYTNSPIFFSVLVIILAVAIIFVGVFVIYIKFIQPNLVETVKCNDCTYKIINKSMATHLNSATEAIGDANGMLKAQGVKIDQLDSKINDHEKIMSGMLTTLSGIHEGMRVFADVQRDNVKLTEELLIRYKIQHKD